MGVEIHPYMDGDDERYPIIEITRDEIWIPSKQREPCKAATAINEVTIEQISDADFHRGSA